MPEAKKEKTKKFRSLRITLTTAFLVLSAVVLLITSSLDLYNNFRHQHEIVSDRQKLIVEEAADLVANFIQEKFVILETTVKLGHVLDEHVDNNKLVLEKLLGVERSFRQAVLLDAEGQVVEKVSRLSNIFLDSFIQRLDSDIISDLNEKGRYISEAYIDEITSEPMLIIAVAVNNIFGEPQGLLIADLNLKFMWDLVGMMDVGKEGVVYVVSIEGKLLAFKDISRVLKGEKLTHVSEIAEFMYERPEDHDDKAEISRGIDGTYVLGTHAHLFEPNWAVFVELPLLEAYKTVIDAFKIHIAILIFAFILAIIVGISLARRITKPIVDLASAALRIGEGDWNTQINIGTRDEIGDLARSFNQMTQNLKTTTTSMENLNKEIIERKKAEENLRKAEEKYRTQFEKAIDAIFIADAETGIIIDCNPAAAELVGRKRSELIGQGQRILHPPEKIKKKVTETFEQHMASPDETLETQVITKDGKIKDVAIKASLIEIGGIKVMQGIFRDITQRKKAEMDLRNAYTQLKQAQDQLIQAEKLNAVGQLASGVAHEVKNPLGIILQGIGYLEKNIPKDKENVSSVLDAIKHNVKRADGIIRGLVDFSRATELTIRPKSINSLLESSLILLEHKLKLSEIKVIKELSPDLPAVPVDIIKIEQVFVNVILNAVQAMSEGGKLYIRT
ncbi:MAG: PAS domain S-box protein, partial [Candidatus Omnitrophica bacterium]|nr:PAS domain S-box protein [Candidatus Omnitrophota bacterium]